MAWRCVIAGAKSPEPRAQKKIVMVTVFEFWFHAWRRPPCGGQSARLIVDLGHDFVLAMNGFVTEASNTIERPSVSVTGGYSKRATDLSSAVCDGISMEASGADSSVVGGHGNDATVERTSASGGPVNTASNGSASVSGGLVNSASGRFPLCLAGFLNDANGVQFSACGGAANLASCSHAFSGRRLVQRRHGFCYLRERWVHERGQWRLGFDE